MSSVFELGIHRSELILSDQDARKDGSIDVGDALVACRTATVANKQAKVRIISRIIGSNRGSLEKSEKRVLFIQNSSLYKPDSTTQPDSARTPRVTLVGRTIHNNCLIGVSDVTEGITSADG